MKRREVLKGLTIAAGGALWPYMAWTMLAQAQNAEAIPVLAVPIRGLVRRDRGLLQPVQITLRRSRASATAVTKPFTYDLRRVGHLCQWFRREGI
jgi:hypothetical protein